MAGDFTDRGRMAMAACYFQGSALPSVWGLALITGSTPCTNDILTLNQLEQIGDSGYSIAAVSPVTEFDSLTEGGSAASVQLTDQSWTAGTGIAPAQAILTFGTAASAVVMAYYDVSGTATAGQPYTLQDATINANWNSGQWTDKGMFEMLNFMFEGGGTPSSFQMVLCGTAVTPDVNINTLSELTQISGSGYPTGGSSLFRNATDFPSLVDGTNQAELTYRAVDFVASGGTLGPARWMVIADGTAASDSVILWGDLSAERNVSDGSTLTIGSGTITITT